MELLIAMFGVLGTYAQSHPFASAAAAAVLSAWVLNAPERPY